MVYACIRCDYYTDRLSSIQGHINRKTPCNPNSEIKKKDMLLNLIL